MNQRALRRWIAVFAVLCAACVLLWAVFGAAALVAKSHGGQWPPAELRGLVFVGLGTLTLIAACGLGDLIKYRGLIVVQRNMLAGQRLILDAFAELAERTEPLARVAPAPVHAVATVGRAAVPVSTVEVMPSAPRSRRRRGRRAPSGDAAYLDDAAEIYELGRRAGLAERPPDAPPMPLS
jgi:hypothetical protein